MKPKIVTAYCYATGLIEFGSRRPKGALPIARGPSRKLRSFIEATARHGYSTRLVRGRPTAIRGTECLLVPGVPEAPNQGEAFVALARYRKWIGENVPEGIVMQYGIT